MYIRLLVTLGGAEKIPDQIAEEAENTETVEKVEKSETVEIVEKSENFGARNFPKEAVERGIAQTLRKKRGFGFLKFNFKSMFFHPIR